MLHLEKERVDGELMAGRQVPEEGSVPKAQSSPSSVVLNHMPDCVFVVINHAVHDCIAAKHWHHLVSGVWPTPEQAIAFDGE